MLKLCPIRYAVAGETVDFEPVYIEARTQKNGENLWVIDASGRLMNKRGKLVYEPFPSNRTDDFIDSTRFASPELALGFYIEYKRRSK